LLEINKMCIATVLYKYLILICVFHFKWIVHFPSAAPFGIRAWGRLLS